MAGSDSDDESYRLFIQEMGHYREYFEDEELYDAAERFLEEQEGSERESEATEDEEEDEDGDADYIPVEDSPPRHDIRNAASTSALPRSGEEERDSKRRRQGEGEAEACSSGRVTSQDSEWNRSEIDGLFCPICMEAWSDDGDHYICCLPCGHIYGMSCIKRWLQQQKKNAGKCPHCNQRCTLKDVRKLFASRVVTVDVESQKRIRQLEATCAALEKKDAGWKKKECEWKNKEAGSESEIQKLRQKVSQLKERTIYLEHLLEEVQNRSIESAEVGWGCQGYFTSGGSNGLELQTERSSRTFEQQMELLMEGARLFDVSASYQMLLVSRRLPGMAVRDALTKISLMNPREVEDVLLPSKTKAVKDLHISPCDGGLVLFASLGKSLAVLSLESNNIVLDYDLPAAAWSCSWDFHRSHYIYAGLQNGTLMVFDMRQTVKPVESLNGLSSNPIHTIQSLSQKNTDGPRSILTASSIGLSLWNVDCREERPTLVPESADEGVCISLACSPNGDDIVATYRPKIDMSTEVTPTQPSANPSPISGQVTQGSHVLFKRSAGSNFLRKSGSMYANVSDIRLPRSAIVGSENQNRFFAFGDEATNEVALQELPSFSTSQRFKLKKPPLRDIKYTVAMNCGLLTCLGDDILQVFSRRQG
ncbi:hypothetical protein CDL15_Pgr002016 [Punica granatum]|uniref:RING-type E3 ubiquitin transferase n=1 Tax=Punica granatum TaxID=22663 RepID=A0A218XDN5_PUNGR|nr:hypothetical protein CDL15_Pgr002016 [Punica granatum]